MPSTIRAAVSRAFGAPLEIETVTLRDPGPQEVEVTIEAVAICHSDISFMDGAWGGALPAVYGHEAVGRVSSGGRCGLVLFRGPARLGDLDPILRVLSHLSAKPAALLRGQ